MVAELIPNKCSPHKQEEVKRIFTEVKNLLKALTKMWTNVDSCCIQELGILLKRSESEEELILFKWISALSRKPTNENAGELAEAA